MRDIKRRRTSVQSTQQITKAMKLVSTVKLQKARTRAEESKPYFDCMYATMTSLLAKAGNINHPYLKADDSKKKAVIVVTSNRGLAGGYNSNVVKMVTENEAFTKENIRIYAIGGKGLELLKHKGYDIVADYSEMIEEPSYDDAKSITKRLLTDFENGEIGILRLLVKAGLASSNGEARRNVEQGGVSVDGEKITDVKAQIAKDSIGEDGIVLKRGKKKFMRIVVK